MYAVKMLLKKLVAVGLACVLLLGLCSCGEQAVQEAVSEQTVIQTEAPVTLEPTPEPTPEPTERPLLPVDITDYCIDSAMFEEAAEQGSVSVLEYTTYDYSLAECPEVAKQAMVYLPSGYSEEEQYDVVFLLHPASADEFFWLFYEHSCVCADGTFKSFPLRNLLDNMIEKSCCRPFIAVAPDCYLDDTARVSRNSSKDFEQFKQEFANDLLPSVVSSFSTYASGTGRAELAEVRRHFGVLGASFGAYMVYRSFLGPNADLLSYYCCTGGGNMDPEWLEEMWYGKEPASCGIDLLYFVEGEYDDRTPVELSAYKLMNDCDSFNQSNLLYTMLYGTGHEDQEWVTALYNALQLFFRK